MSSKVTLVQTGEVHEVDYADGMTVKQAIAAKEWELGDGNEVRLNGAICTDHDAVLKPGDMIMVVGEIAGG